MSRGYMLGTGPIWRFALSGLGLLTSFLAGIGLIASAALKTDGLADQMLALNPHYALAMKGAQILEDRKYPMQVSSDVTQNVGVLTITDPAWNVILNFMKSETAIRKSERNLPSYPGESSTQETPDAKNAATFGRPTEISFDRIKTVIAIRVDLARVGDQPLAPPYRLVVVTPPWRQGDFRTPYEFLSFAEFRLDLRHMILDEMEGWTLWIAVISFGCSLLIEGVRRFMPLNPTAPLTLVGDHGAGGSPNGVTAAVERA